MNFLIKFLVLIVASVIQAKVGDFSKITNWDDYQKKVLSFQSSIHGWCKESKAKDMMDLIFEVKPDVCVEVGVFGGSSIYPTASALKFNSRGRVYAIDPWVNDDCLTGYSRDDANYQWWNNVDLEGIYREFLKMLGRFQLRQYCVVLRMTGATALSQFDDESIDILHIDGNHTENAALFDAQMYFPKVKRGGYIWFDDANWETTTKAREFLAQHCIKDEKRSKDEYFLYRK